MKPHYTNTANPVDFPKVERKMNKLIDELAEQCYVKTGSVHTDHFAYWKFAELIVRECVNRIEQNRSSGENKDSWTITRDMAFHQMKEDLKKHFGVEE